MFCRYCGSQMEENAKFCKSCGRALTEETTTENQTSGADPTVNAASEGTYSYSNTANQQSSSQQSQGQQSTSQFNNTPAVNQYKKAMPGDSDATASMILGIISIVMCSSTIPGIICGVMAIMIGRKAQRLGTTNTGNVTAGNVCGIIGIVLASLSTLYYIGCFILTLFAAIIA